MHSF